MKTSNVCNLSDDEILAEEVRKHPCIYDRQCSGYRYKEVKKQAWRDVEIALDLKEGAAENLFLVLRKRFNRKRVAVENALASGQENTSDVQAEFDRYKFLAWLMPFQKQRPIETSFTQQQQKPVKTEENEEGYFLDGKSDALSFTQLESDSESVKSSGQKKRKALSKSLEYNIKRIKQNDNKRSSLQSNKKEHHEDDKDELFGRLVASDVRGFPEHIKFQLKYEINTIVYKYKMQQLQETSPSSPVQSHSISSQPLVPSETPPVFTDMSELNS